MKNTRLQAPLRKYPTNQQYIVVMTEASSGRCVHAASIFCNLITVFYFTELEEAKTKHLTATAFNP